MSFISKKHPNPGPATGSIDAYELNDILVILDKMFPSSVRFTKTGATFSATKSDGDYVTGGNQGAVASTVIQAANDYLATLVTGGRLDLCQGDHQMTAALTAQVFGYNLRGNGRYATKLLGTAGQNILTLGNRGVTDYSQMTVQDISFQGGAKGIVKEGVYYLVLDRVGFKDHTVTGLELNSTGVATVSNTYLLNCLLTGSNTTANLHVAESHADTELFSTLIGSNNTQTSAGLLYSSNGNQLKIFGGAITNCRRCLVFTNTAVIRNVGIYSASFDDIGSGIAGSDKVGIDTSLSAGVRALALIGSYFKEGFSDHKLIDFSKVTNAVVLANQFYGTAYYSNGTSSARGLFIAGNNYDSGSADGVTYGNTLIEGGIIKRSMNDQVVISDHFVSYTPDTTKWLQTGTGTPTFPMQDQAGGVMRMTTSAGASDTAELTQGGRKLWDMAKLPVSTAKFKMDVVGEGYQFGFYQDATRYIKLQRTTDTGWQLKNKNGGSEVVGGSTTTHTTMTEWRIECNPAIIRLYKDGALVATSTTEIPQGLFEAKIFITNNDAAVHYMDLDWYEQRQTA